MDIDGYIRVAAIVPEVRVADVDFNIEALGRAISNCEDKGANVVVTPELGITAYTCGDLFLQEVLLEAALRGLASLTRMSKQWNCVAAVGIPIRIGGALYNCAALICRGELLGIVPKSWLPNYGEYYEKRWFAPGHDVENQSVKLRYFDKEVFFGTHQLFCIDGVKIGVEICEDLWVPNPPSTQAVLHGADIILNLSATDEVAGKHTYLTDLIRQQSARLRCAYVYASAGFGESSSDLVFSGNGIIAENGTLMAETKRFGAPGRKVTADIDIQLLRHDRAYSGYYTLHANNNNNWRFIDCPMQAAPIEDDLQRRIIRHPFVPSAGDDKCLEIANIQVEGLRRRLTRLGGCPAVIGISGGLDSTLALLVCVMAYDRMGLDRKLIHAITMPGFATTSRTHSNARIMAEQLGVTMHEIPIGKAAASHLQDLGHDGVTTDVTYENAQARERTQVLMDYSNLVGGIVIGTGDLSELALGWCTYNGDHMSMYGINASVPKTLVRHLVAWYGRELDNEVLVQVLDDVLDTPVSPELVPSTDSDNDIGQRTEDLVGPYELHDFYLYHTVRNGFRPRKVLRLAMLAFADAYDSETIRHWLREFVRRFFNQQFKRNCLPDGPKVGSVCLSPRGDWRMPSDATVALWMEDLNESLFRDNE